MTSRKEWLKNERQTDLEVYARATDEYGTPRCELCGSSGHDSKEWRGLHISHTDPKGSGGTRRLYTAEDKKLLCAGCHSKIGHNLKEVVNAKLKWS